MLIAIEQEEANVFIFVPRFYTENINVKLRDPIEGKSVNIDNPEIEFINGYAMLKISYNFGVGNTYPIDIREVVSNKIVFKSQIVCTNKNPQEI